MNKGLFDAVFKDFNLIRTTVRNYHVTPPLSRILRPRYVDVSATLLPDLKVPDTINEHRSRSGDHPSMASDPDAPSFHLDDPYVEPPPKCVICENQFHIDYKNVQLLSQFCSQFTGRIYPRKVVGLCSVKYDEVVRAILFSRKMGLMSKRYIEHRFYDDAYLTYPVPERVIMKRLKDAAADYQRAQKPALNGGEDIEEEKEELRSISQ